MTGRSAVRERPARLEKTTAGSARPGGRRTRLRWSAAATVWTAVVLVVAVVGLVWFSPALGLRKVIVAGSGAGQLSAQVRSAVGIAPGTPLVRIQTADVQRRVEALAPVRSATVVRDWPHDLTVTVTARTPVAVTQANGAWWLVDATGKPYMTVASPPAGLMPLKLATPGQGDRATLAALAVLRALPASLRSHVTSVSAPTAYGVSLALADGRTVVWGAAVDAATKIAVLPALLKRPGTVYNITDPTLATVR